MTLGHHLSAPQRCNAERSDAQRNFFTSQFMPPFLQRHRCDALPCFSASPVIIFYIAHIAFPPLLPFSFCHNGLLYKTRRNASRVTTQRCHHWQRGMAIANANANAAMRCTKGTIVFFLILLSLSVSWFPCLLQFFLCILLCFCLSMFLSLFLSLCFVFISDLPCFLFLCFYCFHLAVLPCLLLVLLVSFCLSFFLMLFVYNFWIVSFICVEFSSLHAAGLCNVSSFLASVIYLFCFTSCWYFVSYLVFSFLFLVDFLCGNEFCGKTHLLEVSLGFLFASQIARET